MAERHHALLELLPSLLNVEELRAFLLRFDLGAELLHALPGEAASAQSIFWHAVDVCERRGVVDRAFFQWLKEARPRRADDIDLVAALWDGEPRLDRPSGARWIPETHPRPRRFVGREQILKDLHARLTVQDDAAGYGSRVVRLVGLGGVGKSLLAIEYAHRFSASWPGGIFWLRATDPLSEALGRVCDGLGLEGSPAPVDRMRARIRAALRSGPYLWVIDDLPHGVPGEVLRGWLAPGPAGATLISTRDRRHEDFGEAIVLGPLDAEDGVRLLAARRPLLDVAEEEAARALSLEVGGHPLALDLLGASLRRSAEARPVAARLRMVRADLHGEALERVVSGLLEELPTGAARGIAATLWMSVLALGEEGRDLLSVAATLSAAPFPLDLARDALALHHRLDREAASERLERAVEQADLASLCEPATLGERGGSPWVARQVHVLVSKAVRLLDPIGWLALRPAVVQAITPRLDGAGDPRRREVLAPLVAHARVLAIQEDGLPEFFLSALVARHDQALGDARRAIEGWRRADRGYAELTGAESEPRLTILSNWSEGLRALGHLDDALDLSRRALAGRRRVLGDRHPDTLGSENNLALLLHEGGHQDEARELAEQTLALRAEVLGKDHLDTLRTANNLGEILWARGDLEGALALHERTLAARMQVCREDDPDLLESLANLARVQTDLGRAHLAVPLQEELVHRTALVHGEQHPRAIQARVNLASTLNQLGRADEIPRDLVRRVEDLGALLGQDAPEFQRALFTVAQVQLAWGDLESADLIAQRLLVLRRALRGVDPAELGRAAYLAACVAFSRRDWATSAACFRESLDILRVTSGAEHPETLVVQANLGESLRLLGEPAEAARLLEPAILRRQAQGLLSHPSTLTMTRCLVQALHDQGRADLALPWERVYWTGVLAAQEAESGLEDPDVWRTLNRLAMVLRKLGDPGEAAALHRRALGARRRALGDRAEATTLSAWNLIRALQDLGAEEEAQALYAELIAWIVEADPQVLSEGQRSIHADLTSRRATAD